MRTDAVRLLFVEDVAMEVELATRQLRREGLEHESLRVETEEDLRAALETYAPDLILSDFSLPQYDGLSALQLARSVAPEIPFIFFSGTIGEERAIHALRSGAVDYVIKGNLARLGPAVRRALEEAEARRERQRQERQIARLNRVLEMLSGINGLVLRIRNRPELLQEACRFAVRVGGYAGALIAAKDPIAGTLEVVASDVAADASSGFDATLDASGPVRTLVDRALTSALDVNGHDGALTLIALPLSVDRTPVGVLVLASNDDAAAAGEERTMLRELAGNLSFGLQYLQTDTRVRFLSQFDPQTALARRPLFCERAQRSLSAAADGPRRFAVGVVDIERLGAINTSFGRRTGDLLLQHVADRLKQRFPSTEELAHFGGGTFAIVREITGPPSGTRMQDLMPQIQEHALALFGEPFELEGRRIPVSARMGVALHPEDGRDAATLVQNAEGALENARSAGEKHFHYRADKHSEAVARLALEHRLRRGLERREFELHYQPKVSVVSGRLQGVEALLRWKDPERGPMLPGVFLPVLESSGLMVEMGRWIIEQAARDCREWRAAGLPPVRVAVNVAPIQLRQPDFAVEFLDHQLAWADVDQGLDVEITEGVLREDSVDDIRKLTLLRQRGVKVAIDDFGTGYSSLSRLSVLPIDTLKIDRSFVSTLGSPSGRILVKTIISLAKAFGMSTVGEGVETQEQLDALWSLGCDQSQGFLHAAAMPADALVRLMERDLASPPIVRPALSALRTPA